MPVLFFAIVAALASTSCGAPSGSMPETVETFRSERVFWKQADLGETLVARGERSVLGALDDWLTHEDRHVRANVAFVFAGLGDTRGLHTLEAIAKDRTPRPWAQGVATVPGNLSEGWQLGPTAEQTRADRYYAVHVLGMLRDRRALRTLLPLLSDPDVGHKVAWALGEIGDPSATPALIETMSAPDPLIRVSAIDALVKLRATAAISHLRALDRDDAVPSAGDRALVSQKALEAIAHLESLGQAPTPAEKAAFAPPPTVRFPAGEQLIAKATTTGCQISGRWWCRVGCAVGRLRQKVRVEPDFAALPTVPQGIVIAELGLDDSGRVRDACLLRGIRPDVDREVIRTMVQWRWAPARLRTGPLAGTPVWPVIVVTATVGPPEHR